MPKLETEEETEFVSYAAKRGCYAFKLILLGLKGWPDRTVIMPGARIAFFEFKRQGNTQSPHQDKWKRILITFGFDWHTPYSANEAKRILDAYLDSPKISE